MGGGKINFLNKSNEKTYGKCIGKSLNESGLFDEKTMRVGMKVFRIGI